MCRRAGCSRCAGSSRIGPLWLRPQWHREMQAASEQAVAEIEPLSEAVAHRRVEHERNAILPPPDGCDLIEQTRAKPVATLGVCDDEIVDVDGRAAHQHLVEPVAGQAN